MTILVIGGSGLIGSQVVRALAGDGHAVRATSRRRSMTFPAGVESAVVDLSDASTLQPALDGVDAVFAYAEPNTAQTLVNQLEKAGIRRLVLLSSADAANNDMDDFNCRRHREPEIIVEQSGLDWTFLRPVAFASNALFWKDQIRFTGIVRSPYPDASQSVIDPRDIGEVAARALSSNQLVGAAPMLTGPESLTQVRQVEILGTAIGRSVGFEAITSDEARSMLAKFLAPEFVELKLTALAKAERQPDPVTDDVMAIIGKAPRSFHDWAKSNRDAFL